MSRRGEQLDGNPCIVCLDSNWNWNFVSQALEAPAPEVPPPATTPKEKEKKKYEDCWRAQVLAGKLTGTLVQVEVQWWVRCRCRDRVPCRRCLDWGRRVLRLAKAKVSSRTSLDLIARDSPISPSMRLMSDFIEHAVDVHLWWQVSDVVVLIPASG